MLIISVIFFMKFSPYLTSDVGVSALVQEQLGHIGASFVGRPHESSPSSLSRKCTRSNIGLNCVLKAYAIYWMEGNSMKLLEGRRSLTDYRLESQQVLEKCYLRLA